MNSVALVGRLSRNPTTRFERETQVTTFTLTITEPSRDGTPFRLYVPCVAWGRSAEAGALLNAEDLVAVQGRLCWRKHVDKQGQDKSAMAVNVREVHVLNE